MGSLVSSLSSDLAKGGLVLAGGRLKGEANCVSLGWGTAGGVVGRPKHEG